jgi:preprotein translocase subunit SecD
VNFTFNLKCAKIFGDLTSKNVGKRFAVVLDNEIITAPRINGAITGGSGYIEGSFTPESAKELSLLLNAGALPAKLIIAEERTVSAELGNDSINAGKTASIIGLIGVAFFMWLSYGIRFGTIANLALTFNIMLIAAALSLLGATLTLPGIAGIILTIGMAVDANVLIFERIREESANGRPPVNAIETGYRLSLAPILDANITTLIAAVTLYFVGSGPIRGFAVTLAIGIVMSVFTAVVVARLMTATWLRRARPKDLPI